MSELPTWAILAGVCLWLAVGWLPSRMVKHYCVRQWWSWNARDERFFGAMAICGPLMFGAVLIALWAWRDDEIPLGWTW